MRWAIFLMIGLVMVAGCISDRAGPTICTEGEERCFGEEKQACQDNQWAVTGECILPVQASEILESPAEFEGKELEVEGIVTAIDGERIQIDDKIWITCISAACQDADVGQEVKLGSTFSYKKIYNMTYTLPRTQSYLAESYELPHDSFPVSSEGAITSDDCNSLSENYFVENGVSSIDSSQYSLSYMAFYNGDPTPDAYNRVATTLCVEDDANINSPFSNETHYVWCAKLRGGNYCHFSSKSLIRENWDWEYDIFNPVDQYSVPAQRNIEILCDSYGGTMVESIEKHILNNIYAFKAPVCKIKIFAPEEMKNTTAYCSEIGGVLEDNNCLILDKEAWDECGNNNDVPEGYTCYLKSDCYENEGSFELKDGEYYCTDTLGITKNDLFDSYDEECLYGAVTICNLKSFTIDEEIITEYNLKETE